SIVEKEARLPEERPVIAAVYYNRLRRGMRLQADPTVQYALGHHVGRVLYKDLAVESPYNTYLHKGLPPGPVASPGVASLAAAANPANVPYLYFVATRDGHHEFRMTLDEHTSAIRQVRAASPKKKTAPRMVALASTTSRTAIKPTSRTASKIPVKTVSKTVSKPTGTAKATGTAKSTGTAVKSPAKKLTTGTSSTKKRSSSRTTTTSR
ncbi:MAG TPA: endolytic transglycosylase MltG, partial [Gemmatimonadaceae bacterium]|nr:endolytic transglycosylase MltG [Gemmatimonadaceae bacterium]